MERQRLTPREQGVARLVAGGSSTPEVARLLGISAKTVEAHLFRVYRKLAIGSRQELADRVREAGGAPLGRATSEHGPGGPLQRDQGFRKVVATRARDSGRVPVEEGEEE